MRNNKLLHKICLITFILATILSCNFPMPDTEQPTDLPQITITEQIPVDSTQNTNETPEGKADESIQAIEIPSEQVYAGGTFAEYALASVTIPDTPAQDYSLPIDLSQVEGVDNQNLSNAQKDLLSQNGFVIKQPDPGVYREFYQIYENQRYNQTPVFVTTDSVFHIYHLLFDKMLRDLERDFFMGAVDTLTKTMLNASIDQYNQIVDPDLKEAARRNVAFFSVAAQLLQLDNPIPSEAADLVNAEMALINEKAGPDVSPIWQRDAPQPYSDLIEDYSQYIPRGHYTRSDDFKRYFLGMMWYGRMTYRLKDDFETQRALLIVDALRKSNSPADAPEPWAGKPATELWEQIYDPTVFIVGKADDLSYHEYGVISDAVFGQNASIESFADETRLAQFSATAQQLPAPQVNSMWVWIWEDKEEATQGFRFMGQRFTLDAYIFGQLIWRNVGTMDNPRNLPKGLDVFAAMGSEEAYNILDNMGETQYENYNTQMDKVRSEVSALQTDSWTQNLYWSWLYSFQPVIEVKDNRYPAFMRTQAWARKDLNSVLGSWTELKHDTILYAKQVMAEMGGGGEDVEPPHSYVEPNPEVYARLQALTEMTHNGLSQRELLNETIESNLLNLSELLGFLQSVSERELAGIELTEDEYWRLLFYGGALEQFTLAAADTEEGSYAHVLEDQKAALIADVATGNGYALEEAIGQPTPIYVVIPEKPWKIGVGAVFSYYEFEVPVSERMTDEEWQAKVESGTNPPLPEWTTLFISP